MNRKLVSKAFTQIDENLIAESFTYRGEESRQVPERMKNMTKERKIWRFKKVFAFAAAACMVLTLAFAAFATNLWGIQNMLRTINRELPQEASDLIQQRNESGTAEGWNARITESLCNGNTTLLTITVYGGEEYIIVPTDIMPEDSVADIGLDGNMTLREYAAEKKKKLLLTGAALPYDELGIFSQSQTFQNISDSEMVILLQVEKTESVAEADTVCTVYAQEAGSEEVQRVDIPLTLTWAAGAKSIFIPKNPSAILGLCIGEATVTETAFGLDVQFSIIAESDDDIYEIERVYCDELSDWTGGFVRDNGTWIALWNMAQGKIPDTLTLRFYNANEESLGVIQFTK